MGHSIADTYSAYWFLSNHPKLNCRFARLIDERSVREERALAKANRRGRVRQVRDKAKWNKNRYWIVEYQSMREALEENLSIFYAKVDSRRKVNDDPAKNVCTECWLEFGPIRYEVLDGELSLQHYHDIRLDCGAPTFDEALVKLARLVRKHYGDYNKAREGE